MALRYEEIVAFIKRVQLRQMARKKARPTRCPRISKESIQRNEKEFTETISTFFVPLEIEHTIVAFGGCPKGIIQTYLTHFQPPRFFRPYLCVTNYPSKLLTIFKRYLPQGNDEIEKMVWKALKRTKVKSFSIAVSTLFWAKTGKLLSDCSLALYVTKTRFEPTVWRVFTVSHLTPFSYDTFVKLVEALKQEIEED